MTKTLHEPKKSDTDLTVAVLLEEYKKRLEMTEEEQQEGCCICAEAVSYPVRLDCKHVFCISCVSEWHRNQTMNFDSERYEAGLKNESNCPICRQPRHGDHVYQHYQELQMLLASANKKLKEDCLYYKEVMNFALECFNTILAALSENTNETVAIFTCQRSIADIYRYLKDYEQARILYIDNIEYLTEREMLKYGISLDVLDMAMDNSPSQGSLKEWHKDILLDIMDCSNTLEDFECTLKAASDVARLVQQHTSPVNTQRKMYHEAYIAYAGLGHLDEVQSFMESLFYMNRHYDKLYGPLVSLLKKEGQLDEAVLWQRRAVAYETPWDEEAVKANKLVLKELLQEREKEKERERLASATLVLEEQEPHQEGEMSESSQGENEGEETKDENDGRRIDVYYARTDGTIGYKEYGAVILHTALSSISYSFDIYDEYYENEYFVVWTISNAELKSKFDVTLNERGWIGEPLKSQILTAYEDKVNMYLESKKVS